MRRNLTISLSARDWGLVRESAQRSGATYSAVFHRLIQATLGASTEVDPKITAKYRPRLEADAGFLEGRAKAWVKASRRARRGTS